MFALPVPPLVDPARGIHLRPWRPADALVLATAWAVPDIAGQASTFREGTVADAERWIAGAEVRREAGLSLDLVVGPIGGDEVWGEVGLARLGLRRAGLTSGPAPRQEVEVGWWVMPGHRGRGVATAAARLLSGWALTDLGAERLVARIDATAAASQVVARRAGFERLGPLGPEESTRDLWVRRGVGSSQP